jgi:endonuclease V-like protein UPF0215 family
MAVTRLRRVKREIRVLGLASKPRSKGHTVIGIVYRGALWLDGLLTLHLEEGGAAERIAEMVRESPHHPQIRVILLHDELLEGVKLDPYRLHLGAERPVIALSRKPRWLGSSKGVYAVGFKMELGGCEVHILSIGLRSREAAAVLKVATRSGETLPEALRVAELVARALPEQKT